MPTSITTDFEKPYPLKQQFMRIVLPGLAILTLLIALVMGHGSAWLTEKIYLEISQNRAMVIDRALNDRDPKGWAALQETEDPKAVFQTPAGSHLLETLRDEVMELGLAHLKVYGEKGLVLYSSDEEQIGTYDPSEGYLQALKGVRNLVEKQLPDQSILYELYIKVPNTPYKTVMELYEPVDYLNQISRQIVIPATLLPVGFLCVLALVMIRLVNRAESDIHYRSHLLDDFKSKLQSLVSNQAVRSLRESVGQHNVPTKRIRATILFSDVRGFTDFSESQPPEVVVDFLNQSLGAVIESVEQEGGDVDKMIGDAVLAYFQGDTAEKQALNAAIKALKTLETLDLPRGVGLGIFTGDIVVGTLGAAKRKDFTIIGDTVNTASRLCSAAGEGQIVIDAKSFQASTLPFEHQTDRLQVKGKTQPIDVCRLQISAKTSVV